MNTKTMRLPPRRVLTQTSGPPTPNKRRERDEGLDTTKPSSSPKLRKPENKPRPGGSEPSNQLLAGYLAHEFLTRGTLFGQPWDPPRVEGPTEKRKGKQSESESGKGEAEPQPPTKRADEPPEKYERYVEVAGMLNVEGPHLPGIVNPTQLARFLQL